MAKRVVKRGKTVAAPASVRDLSRDLKRVKALVKAAKLPAVEESLSYGAPSLKVAGKFLARVREPDILVLMCALEEKEFLMQNDPDVFFETDHYKGWPAVLIRLSKIGDEELKHRLHVAWRRQAPKKLHALDPAGESGTDGGDSLTKEEGGTVVTAGGREPRVWVFFYGSYMNFDVLAEVHYAPETWEVACLPGFDIKIAPRANLVRAAGAVTWGINATATHTELDRLYTVHAKGLLGETYLPEAAITHMADGALRPVMTYICPAMEARPADPAYVERIAKPARTFGLPGWYIARIESFKP